MTVASPAISPGEKLAYSVEEAARLLGISKTSAYQATQVGELPTVRIGRRLLVPKAALDRLLSGGELTTPAIPAPGPGSRRVA